MEHNKKMPEKSKGQLRTVTKKKAMLEALVKSMGVVESASKICGVSRINHYRWLNEDADYKQEVEMISEMAIDLAESKLLKCINDEQLTAIIFYLKTKGKSRGYVERIETEQRDVNEFSDYSDEELLERYNKLREKRVK